MSDEDFNELVTRSSIYRHYAAERASITRHQKRIEKAEHRAIDFDAALVQTVFGGVLREMKVVFDAGESFFLSGRDDFSIHHQSGGGIMIKGGNPQYCRHFDSRKRRDSTPGVNNLQRGIAGGVCELSVILTEMPL